MMEAPPMYLWLVTVRAADLKSRSKNTPFDGWHLTGGVAATIVGGRLLYASAAAPLDWHS